MRGALGSIRNRKTAQKFRPETEKQKMKYKSNKIEIFTDPDFQNLNRSDILVAPEGYRLNLINFITVCVWLPRRALVVEETRHQTGKTENRVGYQIRKTTCILAENRKPNAKIRKNSKPQQPQKPKIRSLKAEKPV